MKLQAFIAATVLASAGPALCETVTITIEGTQGAYNSGVHVGEADALAELCPLRLQRSDFTYRLRDAVLAKPDLAPHYKEGFAAGTAAVKEATSGVTIEKACSVADKRYGKDGEEVPGLLEPASSRTIAAKSLQNFISPEPVASTSEQAATAAKFSPSVGSWAILDQDVFACHDWEGFLRMKRLAVSRDESAFIRAAWLQCEVIFAGAVLWINDAVIAHSAFQVRPKGSLEEFWMPQSYRFKPAS